MLFLVASLPPLLASRRFIDHPLVITAIFLGGLAVFIYLAYRLNKFVEGRRVNREEKRTRELVAALNFQGLTRAPAQGGLLQSFEIGQRGEAGTRKVSDLMQSPTDGAETLRMMDCIYTAFDGRRRVNLGHTCVLFERRDLALPHFHLTKEEQFQWAQKLLKTQDIDFADYPRFSKMYHLRGEDEAALRALFQPPLLAALEEHPGLTIEGRDTQLLIFREGEYLAPKRWPGLLDEARQVARLFLR